MTDLTACNNCIKVTDSFDSIDTICNSCASRVQNLLNLDFTASSFKIYKHFGELQGIVWSRDYKPASKRLSRMGVDLESHEIELLLAPIHLQNAYLEVQEFIT